MPSCTIARVWTTTEYPLPRDSYAWQADLFRIDPQDILVGVMPELSLGRGKEVMPYLNDEERLEGFLALLDETSSMGHVVPNHRKVLEKGLEALLRDLRKRHEKASTDDQRDFTYYDVSLGWNLLPGEVFFGGKRAFNSALYVVIGAGNTEFAGDDFFTVTYGAGFRVLLTDSIAAHFDVRDHMLDIDVTGEDKTTHNVEFNLGASWFF